ncbi:AAA family ATPase [Petroclostridium sp. X23]|uniref:AAA family ATPase n=1 Tax=Petroclostridium sp. X23 TaxID=3045146 RepID=UPI0024AD32F7|nr:AAA family ATPase [Petroclostridium sp. X23]WHH58644.1 AAA family ATPase [Petroclostridium sp. X23]
MCKFIMMIGIPGSGKSTFAEEIKRKENGVIVSSDQLREELFGTVWEFRKNADLFSEMFSKSHMYLNQGKSVVFDATNIRRSERKSILKRFMPYYKECYYIKISLEKALYQNKIRDRNVPENVIIRMYDRIQDPQLSEGWDKVNIIDL